MTQKILAGRTDDGRLAGDLVRVKVDQVVLARQPRLVVADGVALGMKKTAVETAVVYETHCVTSGATPARGPSEWTELMREAPGILLARPGIGFPAPVHLERFASPGRLALTDEPRLASTGGAGMLTLTVSPAQLASALTQGHVLVRPPRTVQVLLSGKPRPFVCVRDVALELVRRQLAEIIQRIDETEQAPVVLEFAGPSARLLSVPDRAVLASLAPQLGATAALFVSDEKTEVYLRDQRRSKAHRALVPDAGAPCEDVISVDLSAVDPLLKDQRGVVRPVRELADQPVAQVFLGGDAGASLRDLLAAAALLKSKRVPPGLDLLFAPPSRQTLEVLGQSGALVDLIATGARLVEPDQRLVAGDLYPPPADGLSLRTFDPEPNMPNDRRFVVASAETLAFAVATGKVGDPRGFKRPVRVAAPRVLPTEDALLLRKGKGRPRQEASPTEGLSSVARAQPWTNGTTLQIISKPGPAELTGPSAVIIESLEQLRWVAHRAADLCPHLRAVIATHIPRGTVPVFAGLGILALGVDESSLAKLRGEPMLGLPPPERWNGEGITGSAGGSEVKLRWLAVGAERNWTTEGTAALPRAARPSEAIS